ncbi:hypothetical protein SHIRM173S_06290 [Streptomyces hirsutus]
MAAYLAEWGTTGSAAARWRARKPSLSIDPSALADSPARRHANDRWAAHEPVLTALAAAAGVGTGTTATRTTAPRAATPSRISATTGW